MRQVLPPATHRLRGLLATALVVGSALATALAVGVVVGVFWWLGQASSAPPAVSSAPRRSNPPVSAAPLEQAEAPRPVATTPPTPPAVPKAAPAKAAPPVAARPSAPPPAAAVPAVVPVTVPPKAVVPVVAPPKVAPPVAQPPAADVPVPPAGSEARRIDADRNRSIVQGLLQKAGEDPEVQRHLAELEQEREAQQPSGNEEQPEEPDHETAPDLPNDAEP
jgi:hypothetical protein